MILEKIRSVYDFLRRHTVRVSMQNEVLPVYLPDICINFTGGNKPLIHP